MDKKEVGKTTREQLEEVRTVRREAREHYEDILRARRERAERRARSLGE